MAWQNGDDADVASLPQLLTLTSEALDNIAIYLTWHDLRCVMSCCRVAFASIFRQEFVRQTRLRLPPDNAIIAPLAASSEAVRTLWSIISIAHTHYLAPLRNKTSDHGVLTQSLVIEPQRYMLPLFISTSAMDLTLIQHAFPAIRELDLSSISELVDLSPLACLTELRSLNLSATGVQDLTPLSHLRRLQTLRISMTRITTIEPLRGLPQLVTLDLEAVTKLCSLAPLETLPSLTSRVRRVKCENAIQQLTTIAPRLLELFCCQSVLQSARPPVRYQEFHQLLSELSNVETLEISSHVTLAINVDSFATLTRLRRLRVAILATSDLSPLATLRDLEELSLTSSKCVDLTVLAALPRLRSLYCHGGDPDSMEETTATSHGIELLRVTTLDVSNHYLARLRGLPSLEELTVYVWNGDTLMLPIGCANKLKRFRLSGDMDVREIHSRFPDLEDLELQQCASYTASHLTLFEKLQSLTLKGSATDDVLPKTAELPLLRVLRFHGPNAVDLTLLTAVPNLRELDLEKSNLHNVSCIKALQKLEVLNLKGTNVRDVTPLLEIKSLRRVFLPKSAVCAPLVAAYHGSSGGQLQEVVHPTKNCLWGPHRKRIHSPSVIGVEMTSTSTEATGVSSLVEDLSKCSVA